MHGILFVDIYTCSGSASLSPDEQHIIVSNLIKSFDCYNLENYDLVWTYAASGDNVILPSLLVATFDNTIEYN